MLLLLSVWSILDLYLLFSMMLTNMGRITLEIAKSGSPLDPNAAKSPLLGALCPFYPKEGGYKNLNTKVW
jgi:hypothetical protein